MTALDAAAARIKAILVMLNRSQWVPQLLVRLFVGYFFFETGWAKIHNLDGMTQRFVGWGIPFPAFSAALSAYTELIGGTLIVVGLLTRLAAIPLVINMVVAVLTVKLKAVTGLDEFVELDEPLYALVFLWLLFSGPGRVSWTTSSWTTSYGSAAPRTRPSLVDVFVTPETFLRAYSSSIRRSTSPRKNGLT